MSPTTQAGNPHKVACPELRAPAGDLAESTTDERDRSFKAGDVTLLPPAHRPMEIRAAEFMNYYPPRVDAPHPARAAQDSTGSTLSLERFERVMSVVPGSALVSRAGCRNNETPKRGSCSASMSPQKRNATPRCSRSPRLTSLMSAISGPCTPQQWNVSDVVVASAAGSTAWLVSSSRALGRTGRTFIWPSCMRALPSAGLKTPSALREQGTSEPGGSARRLRTDRRSRAISPRAATPLLSSFITEVGGRSRRSRSAAAGHRSLTADNHG